MSTLTQRISHLSSNKRALLEALLKEKGVPLSRSLIVPRQRNSNSAPLSFAQQRLWFLHQLEPESSSYNVGIACRIRGSLDPVVLEKVFNEIFRRHDVFRTTFHDREGVPAQVVGPILSFKLPLIDVTQLSPEIREAELRRLVTEQTNRPFDLARGPLFRINLVKLAHNHHALLMPMHHIVIDGWSTGILMRELDTLYNAFSREEPSPLSDLPIQYAEYATWQREWLQGEVLEEQISYWKDQLAGAPPLIDLPLDGPRPPIQAHRGAGRSLKLSAELSNAAKHFCRQEDVTLNMAMFATFVVLLHRYTRQNDVVVGTVVAGRNRLETEGLIGCFANTLVLKSDLSGNPTFREALRRVKEIAIGAQAHQEFPLEKLVEVLQPQRSLSYSPLFQVMFLLENALAEERGASGLEITPLEIDVKASAYDLEMIVRDGADGLVLTVEFDSDLFHPDTVERLLVHYQTLLQSAITGPDQPVAALPLMSEKECSAVRAQWNGPATEFQHGVCIQQLVEAQARKSPGTVAIEFSGQKITYGELNARANQLAGFLLNLGVAPETLVGICIDRSPEMLAAVIGTLKAGGAYLPLDPLYSKDRLAFILEDAHVKVLLSQQHLAAGLPRSSARLVCIDTQWNEVERWSTENPVCGATPSNQAYVIYTSGSTGKPKGTVVSHRSLLNYVESTANAYQLTSSDRVLQFASLSFDASAEEIFPCLVRGGSLVLRTDAMLDSIPAFLNACEQMELTVLNLPTAYWHEVTSGLEVEHVSVPNCVRLVIIGGERALPEKLSLWLKTVGNRLPLLNIYGPTEATIGATRCELAGLTQGRPGKEVPIGRPIENVCTCVLDEFMQPVPIAIPGELYIGGAGVARGYLNRPGTTAEKFLPDPFSNELGARLYGTGDIVRLLSDGNLEYIGRADDQVKIRGYRIELGEVENRIGQFPALKDAVVVVREDGAGQRQLVAYVVPRPGEQPTVSELHSFLKQTLPEYMVPGRFVFLEQLPVNANGKIDRKALPEPEGIRPILAQQFVAPRNPVEEVLAAIWAELLKLDRLGVHDNFFDLGGHSLLATQVLSRTRQMLQVELPLRRIFDHPTIAELAMAIERETKVSPVPQSPSIVHSENDGYPPLSFAQQRLWFLQQLEPASSAYNIAQAVRVSGTLHVDALQDSLAELIRRHDSLRTTFQEKDGTPSQVVHSPDNWFLPVIDLSELEESQGRKQAESIARMNAREGFDLSAGPLFRAALAKLGEKQHFFLINMHHIISDGWSHGIFISELSQLYRAYCQGKPSPLPELVIQYADYAIWQRQWLQGEVLERELQYWKKQLAGAPPLLELPLDRPRPLVQTFRGAHVAFDLPAELTTALAAFCKQQRVTTFIALLTAFKVLLSRYSRQQDIVVGTPIAGRSRLEIERLIGFFVNSLALRTDLSGDPSFAELLHRVREVALEAHTHQDLPFEKLVEEIQPQRSLSYTPIFQVMFTFEARQKENIELPGLKLDAVEAESETSKFDLAVFFEERGQYISGSIEYNTDLFDRQFIQRMTVHLHNLIELMVKGPNQSISRAEMLSPAEKRQLLVDSNRTHADFGLPGCLHHLFEQQVQASPEEQALALEDSALTFAELNARANQLAHYLIGREIGPESLVALCMERSLDLIVAMLGVLKSGAAFVPLDPGLPADRLSFMLQDTSAALVLTSSQSFSALPDVPQSVICMTSEWDIISGFSQNNPATTVSPENLSYIIYTSGSSGKPKGAGIQHGSLCNLAAALHEAVYAQFPHVKRVSLNAPLVFDASILQLLQLTKGRSIFIIPEDARIDAVQMISYLKRHKLEVLDCTPTHLKFLLEAGLTADPDYHPTLVLAGGEAIDRESWNRMAADQYTTFFNLYGPTEATVMTSFHRIEAGEGPVIGRPLANLQVYIVDENFQLVPVGVPGELCVGGIGVGRGYYKRASLTAEKFVPDPFGGEAGRRLYRTGDLVRYRREGTIEYLGRIDDQVKVRGYRIELGEIESQLRGHSGVAEAAVMAREEEGGEKRLVGYAVMREGVKASGAELQAYLEQSLPEYMVPRTYVFLEEMPITPGGKINKRALPAPQIGSSEKAYVPPVTPIEGVLAGIWEQVLGLERVGIQDNFFELGGHSLLATQVLSRVRKALEVELPLRSIFERPTIAELAVIAEEAIRSGNRSQVAPIVPTRREAHIPLSFAQQRLWFIHQLQPASAVYNIPMAVCISGNLNVEVLERSLAEVVRRHESLRTTFCEVDGIPGQVIHPVSNWFLPVIDLSSLDESTRTEAAQSIVTLDSQSGFDLSSGPLFRAALVRVTDDNHVFLASMHHIISDGWSAAVFNSELEQLYLAYRAGKASPLPELAIQYADFAAWQRQWLAGAALDREIDYCKKQLAGAPPLLELPTDYPRPAIQSFHGAHVPVELSPELTRALRALCRQERVTVFMALLAAFQLLLGRYSRQSEIVVGTPIAGRNRLETEPLIGFFVNTLVLRTDLSGIRSFTDLLNRVKEITLEAHAHQELPFEKLVEEIQPQRSLAYAPVFQVMFSLDNASRKSVSIPGLEFKSATGDSQASKFDLRLGFEETREQIRGWLQYNTDLFAAETIQRMVTHFQNLLVRMVQTPGQNPFTAPLLTDEEERVLLVRWNDTQSHFGSPVCLHHLFEIQSQATPDALAVAAGETGLSFAELNALSNQLAHYLICRGIGPEMLVALCLPRCPELIVAILGILKAGAAFVPLDSTFPASRITFMMQDTGAQILLTQNGLLPAQLTLPQPAVCIDREWGLISTFSQDSPATSVTPGNLAYVIYTSGSTGRPKGVAIQHDSVFNLVSALHESIYSQFPAPLRVGLNAPLIFDASIKQLIQLTRGHSLVMIPESVRASGDLPTYMQQHKVDVLDCTPTHLRYLLDMEGSAPASGGGLKLVLVGGEAIDKEIWKKAAAQHRTTFFNVYGPTECTVDTLFHRIEAGEGPVIGRPLANLQVYIVDENFQLVPVGVPGELCVGGIGVGRGYYKRASLTAEKFVPDPFGGEAGRRLYRTGDLVRYRREGTIEYLGRIDDQVKVRGYRIELGEIESQLRGYSGVAEAAVMAREEEGGEKRLVGYAVMREGVKASGAELQAYLEQSLPEYMVPRRYVFLEEMPITPGGKINKRALPAPAHSEESGNYLPPRDQLEFQLVRIWEDLLKVRPIGIKDNFFALGGHSLMSVVLMSRIEQELGEKPPLVSLFHEPTVEYMAASIRNLVREERPVALVPIQPNGDAPPLFFVHPVGGQVLCYLKLAQSLGTAQPFYGLQSLAPKHGAFACTRIEEMAAGYIAEIKSVQPQGPFSLGGWSMGGVIAFEMARQLEAAGERVDIVAMIDSHLERGRSGKSVHEDQTSLLKQFVRDFGLETENARRWIEQLAKVDAGQQLARLLQLAEDAGAIPGGMLLESFERLFEIFKTNLIAALQYQPHPVAARVVLMSATENSQPVRKSVKKWKKWADNFQIHEIDATHYTILSEPHLATVSDYLRACLQTRKRS